MAFNMFFQIKKKFFNTLITKGYSWRDTNGYGEEEEINYTPPQFNPNNDINQDFAANYDEDNSFERERKNKIIASCISLWENADIVDSFFSKTMERFSYKDSDSESETETVGISQARYYLSSTFSDLLANKNDDSDEGLYSDYQSDSETCEASEISDFSESSSQKVTNISKTDVNTNTNNNSINNDHKINDATEINSTTKISHSPNEPLSKISQGKGAKGKRIKQNLNKSQNIFQGPKKKLPKEQKNHHLYSFFEIDEIPLNRLKSRPLTLFSNSSEKFPSYFKKQLKAPKIP